MITTREKPHNRQRKTQRINKQTNKKRINPKNKQTNKQTSSTTARYYFEQADSVQLLPAEPTTPTKPSRQDAQKHPKAGSGYQEEGVRPSTAKE